MAKEPTPPSTSQKFILIAVVANLCFSIALFVWKSSENVNVVYVDVVRLMKGYKGMEEAKKEFSSKSALWQANLDTLRREAEESFLEYEKTKGKATAREAKLMENLIETKRQQYVNYEQNIKEQIQKQDQELSQKVLDKVNDFIKRYGKEKGYSFIMAATQYGNIVYAEQHVDITDDVLNGLNAEFESR